MAQVDASLSTGITGLDRLIKGLIPGDNIVWQVDSVDDYRPMIEPYCGCAGGLGRDAVYFRFGEHEPLLAPGRGVRVVELDPAAGFEDFTSRVHKVISETPRGGYFVFDLLSGLAEEWGSDQMLGNFFMLTCPYLYDVSAIAYFALARGFHSGLATTPIFETAQVVIDVYRRDRALYFHPQKVQQRHSTLMYMLHVWSGDEIKPVKQSGTIAEVLTAGSGPGLASAACGLGVWNRAFHEAERAWAEHMETGGREAEVGAHKRKLLRMMVTRDERVLALAEKHFTLSGLFEVRKRLIGAGLIGGKSVGMLLARAILEGADPRWRALLEPHDSFYIGSDIFYAYVVRNGCWWLREKQRRAETCLEGADLGRQRMLTGAFPDDMVRQFQDILDYYGQSPIIVRSSSLLEDNFGNAFSGKYDSVFCANRGSREKRLEDFLSAVRTIYASSMSERALEYRMTRGLLDRDEQMALLVQRVSGALRGSLFYPQIAGVALSYNPYVWSEYIDPAAGMTRLVFGLGTRAVDRRDDDYTRIVALNAPERRPETSLDEVRTYSQRKVDYIDLEAGQLVTGDFETAAAADPELDLELFAARDRALERRAAQTGAGRKPFSWVLTFETLLGRTGFAADLADMLGILHRAYDYPVDVEYTANFDDHGRYRINLVQCRPLQVGDGVAAAPEPPRVDGDGLVFESRGAVIGHSRVRTLDRIVYVSPAAYSELPMNDRYSVARLMGRINRLGAEAGAATLLIGPGRWGTTMPSLGVPVSFSEINAAAAVCEIVGMGRDIIPDVSLGTHFFNDLVESGILYAAIFPDREENALNSEFLASAPNALEELVPSAARWSAAVRVIRAGDPGAPAGFTLHADALKQRVVCLLEPEPAGGG